MMASSTASTNSPTSIPQAIQADGWTEEPPPPPPRERLEKAKEENEGGLKVLATCGLGLCCLPGCIALGIAMLVIGLLCLDRCPAEPLLPFFAIGKSSQCLFRRSARS